MKEFVIVDLENKSHCIQLLKLLNEYMEDEMGIRQSMPEEKGVKIIDGLKTYTGYLGFFVCIQNEFVALANCNLNYSTWQAKPLLNIHDFIVSPEHRQKGIGTFLLDKIEEYSRQNGFCRINLEVRYDNSKAKKLYSKAGYGECKPPMNFWEKNLE